MTNLEQRMLEAIAKLNNGNFGNTEIKHSKACAAIAIEEIKKAWKDGNITGEVAFQDGRSQEWIDSQLDTYLIDNNLISK